MNTYSHKDHFQYAITDNRYRVQYGHTFSPTRSFREECERAASLVGVKAREANLPIFAYMSGGQDSEVMARSFLAAKVPFVACILRYEDNKNEHDIRNAISFCQKNNVQQMFVDMNISRFIKTEYVRLANKYECPNLSIISQVWCIENLEPHFPALGGGDIELMRCRDNAAWNYDLYRKESTISLAPIKALKAMNRGGATRFLSYTPEQMYSYIMHPNLQFVIKNERSFATWWEREWKSVVYHEQWLDMEPRQKYDGFEKVPEAFPYKWVPGRILNPVTDYEAANAVSMVLEQNRWKIRVQEIPLKEFTAMLAPAF